MANRKTLLLSALFALLSAPAIAPGWAQAEEATDWSDAIIVEDTRIQEPGRAVLALEERDRGPVTDGGDLLRTFPGVSGSRLGGHGMEPVIRGQSQNRLNILLDGAYVHGGCPNRMDPPSSYGSSETYDEVEVIRGVQTVRHGGGGGGGTVLFNRNTQRLTEEEPFRGRIGGGYRSNADAREGFVDLTAGGPQGFVRATGNYSAGENYEDGDGQSVRSAYEEATGNLLVGWTPNDDTRVELGFEANRADDVLYAGAGMDTPYTDHDAVRLKFEHRTGGGLVRHIEGRLNYSAVDHLMDNYTFRAPPAAAMYMRAPSDSDTLGGQIELELAEGPRIWNVGLDYQENQRDAIRYRGTVNNVNTVQSYLWPDVTLRTIGLYGEGEWALEGDRRVRFGLRYDRVEASADRTTDTPNDAMGAVAKLSAAGLYTAYYGDSSAASDENNLGGILRFEQDYAGGAGSYFISLSRSVRTADANERYIASNNNANQDNRWVGNPFLEPEAHHQLELGSQWRQGSWETDASLFYNRVSNYILRDRDHGLHGAGNATIYRNVSATLMGGEISVNHHWSDRLRSGMSLAYVHAHNTTDDRPLAQTPPLDATLTTDYETPTWSLGGQLRLVARQGRADSDSTTGSGLDVGQTAGFQVVDLYGAYRFDNDVLLKLGVDNVMDEGYAEHLNRSNAFDATQMQVNEPGRIFWLTASMAF